MLYTKELEPTLQGTAYHSMSHLPFPLVAWSRSPFAHSGHLQQKLSLENSTHSAEAKLGEHAQCKEGEGKVGGGGGG